AALAAVQLELGEHRAHAADRLRRQLGDRELVEPHVARDLVEALALARCADVSRVRSLAPPSLLAGLLLVEAAQLQARAETRRAPAVPRVEGEQPGIELREAARARGTRALGGKDRRSRCGARLAPPARRRFGNDVHDALAEIQRSRERSTKL